MTTYSILSAGSFERSIADLIAIAPSSVADNADKDPRNRPVGVRAPATMTEPAAELFSVKGFSSGQ
jgi:hypothetical protein